LNEGRWKSWLLRNGIRCWPRGNDRRLKLDRETFKEMSRTFPEVRPVYQLESTLARMRPHQLAVGSDGRHHSPLPPFISNTGRNQPSSPRCIFGPASWVRGLIKPAPGWAVAYVDFVQQEVGIAAALSRDSNLCEAYQSGDCYLGFARQAGQAPPE